MIKSLRVPATSYPGNYPGTLRIIGTAKPFASQYQFSFVVFFLNGLARVLQMKVSRVINW